MKRLSSPPGRYAIFAAAFIALSAGTALAGEDCINWTPSPPITASISASASTVCVGSQLTVSVTASDEDTCYGKHTGIPYRHTDSPFHYDWTALPTGCSDPGDASEVMWTPTVPGVYTFTVTVTDDPNSPPERVNRHDAAVERTITVTVVRITLIYPTNGQKVSGYNEENGIRETRQFYLDMIATVEPNDVLDQAQVTFVYSKGTSQNSANGVRVPGTNQFKYAEWDIRQRFTTSSARYRIKAQASVGGATCETTENLICIKKGIQSTTLATDWTHYPYQWGSKGPDACSHIRINGMPADNNYDHEPFSNGHPAGGAHHYCCFDCSGFAWKCLSYVGVSLPQGSAATQYATFADVSGSFKIGDLLFLGSTPGSIHHVMVANSDGGISPAYYEAPYTGEWTRASSGGWDYAAGPSGDGWCMDDTCTH